jgi:hypothetical protein
MGDGVTTPSGVVLQVPDQVGETEVTAGVDLVGAIRIVEVKKVVRV